MILNALFKQTKAKQSNALSRLISCLLALVLKIRENFGAVLS